MNITCPNCHKKLRVPDGAVGRRARCPACQSKFVIADPEDTNFETIAGFILDEEAATNAIKQRQQKQPTMGPNPSAPRKPK